MLRGDCGATRERPWSFPARSEGQNEDIVEEADGESEVLLCEGWIAQGGVEGSGKWEKKEEGNSIVINVIFQSEWRVTDARPWMRAYCGVYVHAY